MRHGRLVMVERRRSDRLEWVTLKVTYEPCFGETFVYVSLAEKHASHLLASGVEDAATVRERMTEWLGSIGYSIVILTDFQDKEDWSASEQLAEKFREQFLGGDFTPVDCGVYVRWFSRHSINTMALGECYSYWHAEIFLPELLGQLLAGCTNDNEREIILDGQFCLIRSKGCWRDRHGEPMIVKARALLPVCVRPLSPHRARRTADRQAHPAACGPGADGSGAGSRSAPDLDDRVPRDGRLIAYRSNAVEAFRVRRQGAGDCNRFAYFPWLPHAVSWASRRG